MYSNDTNRTLYRSLHSGLIFSEVKIGQSDLHIGASVSVEREAREALPHVRAPLDAYASAHPEFVGSFEPLPDEIDMPAIVLAMAHAARPCGVGPMAAVAGAVADEMARALSPLSHELIIENGGDIFLRSSQPRTILVYAGRSPLSGKLGVKMPPGTYGVCTSSASVGHAKSFGRSDAALVVAKDAAFADAAATALGNRVSVAAGLAAALDWICEVPGVLGALAIVDGALGAKGEIELLRVDVKLW